MDKMWFYAKEGSAEKTGPLSETDMLQLISDRVLKAGDLAWSEGRTSWTPIREIAELAPMLPGPAAGKGVLVPHGLSGWMGFSGLVCIVLGVLMCLGCVTTIIGVPLLVGGIALLGAKATLDRIPDADQPELRRFFLKLRTYLIMTGMVYVVVMLGLLLLFSTVFAAMVSG